MDRNIIPVQIENVNHEILAKIAQVESRKHGCDVEINFANGNRSIYFRGSEEMKTYIAEAVVGMLSLKCA